MRTYCIFDLHTSKARYELKVVPVLLHLWRVSVKTIGGFINIPLADSSHINLRHNNITIRTIFEELRVPHCSALLFLH
jgi:hypothetical protein